MMNSMERILATLAGKSLDRRACTPVLGLYGAKLTNCPLEQYYNDPVAYARGQAAVRETFSPDVLCAPLAFASIGAAFGGELEFLEAAAPNLRRPAVQSLEEWDSVAVPDPETHPKLRYFLDVIRLLVAEHKKEVPVAMVIPIPADIPAVILGMETWLEIVLFDPAGVARVMEKVIPFYIDLVNRFFAAGAAFVVMPTGFASATIVTRETVKTFTRPLLEQVLPQIRGPVILHNVGAPMLPHLDLLAGLPSVAGYIVDQRDDLPLARQVVGPEAVLFGGLDCGRIGKMRAQEVENYCRTILHDRQKDPRFILGTSGPDVVWNTPKENIRAMRKAVEAFGPIDL